MRPSSCLRLACLLGCLAIPGVRAGRVDFAESIHMEEWVRHPVYGDPSFDAFERLPGNPIHRGAPPFAWPVNGFLFGDPQGGGLYAYIGDYGEGYLSPPSRCLLYRSADAGRNWASLGVVLQGDPGAFDKGGHTPDVSVVYDAGRYHMIYDWGEKDFNQEGGIAYAWAERPEGPWHRAPEPVVRNTTQAKLLGAYQRTYAATLVKRAKDWLVLGMKDVPPQRWALFAITAPHPAGPYGPPRLVRNVDGDYFHPPLMEFFPAFVREGFVYAPATSVARNRNFNALFRAPLERAGDPGAWELFRHGSVWHSEPAGHESAGIWGQTFSGWVDPAGMLWALFPSRDSRGMGTINLARRPWPASQRERGFVLSGHGGPSLTCLRRAWGDFQLDFAGRLQGQARVFWDYRGALGPDQPASDATLHPLAWVNCQALEWSADGWRLLAVDAAGKTTVHAAGNHPADPLWRCALERRTDGRVVLRNGDKTLWEGRLPAAHREAAPGALGLWVNAHSHLAVERFAITGDPQPARLAYLFTEGLLGAGQGLAAWRAAAGPEYRFGQGLVATNQAARAKWNVAGTRLSLWAPTGPQWGKISVVLDGATPVTVDLHAPAVTPSSPVWSSGPIARGFHAVVVRGVGDPFPLDSLAAED